MKTAAFRIFGVFIFALALSASLYAGDAGRESQFSIGSGVRAVGMGGGFVGIADDASAVYWNQAALAYLDYQEVNLMHVTLLEGSVYDVASYVYPHHKVGGFGISFMRLGTGNIIKRVEWEEEGEFGYSISQLILGYGRRLEGGFAFGTALKIVNQSLDNNSAYGVGLDISFFKPLTDNVRAGLIFQDIVPPQLRLDEKSEQVPHTVLAGIGVQEPFPVGDFITNFNLALEIPEDRNVKLHGGFEAVYRDYFDFRAGYDRDNLTFGIGFYHKKMRLDYAYRLMEGITDSHRLGLALKIGLSVPEKIQREKDLQDARGSYLILDDRNRQFEFYKNIANRFYREGNLDSAFAYYQRTLAYKPSNPGVLGKINVINNTRRAIMEQEQIKVSRDRLQKSLLDGYYAQAEHLRNQGLYTASLEVVTRALEMEPAEPRFLLMKGKINQAIIEKIGILLDEAARAEKEDRLSDAVVSYNSILQLSPDDITAGEMLARTVESIDIARFISLGVEAFYSDRLSEARRNFENVLDLEADNLVAQKYLSEIAELMRQPEELDDLKKDEKVWKVYLEGLEHYQNGEYEKAIELWKKVLEHYPGNKMTLENIRQAQLRLEARE
jgi:tetratricopeptide (TPR) repeat protein